MKKPIPQLPLSSYQQKLLDPRWQKKRLEILQRDHWTCQICADTLHTLHVHHHYYNTNTEPWDYPDKALITLCEACHEEETNKRPETERLLLRVFREQGFFYQELNCLLDAFHEWEPPAAPSLSISMIAGLVRCREFLQKEYKKYEDGCNLRGEEIESPSPASRYTNETLLLETLRAYDYTPEDIWDIATAAYVWARANNQQAFIQMLQRQS